MTPPQSSAGLPPVPQQKSGQEIYDSIMRDIEPELLSAQLPTLEERCKSDTPAQAKERAERYIRAMEEYEKRYALYRQSGEANTRSFKIKAIHFVEQKAAGDERAKMLSLESALGGSL